VNTLSATNENFHTFKISLCMIVKNEAHTIERAIRSVKPIVNQIIVVDTGSKDDTPAIAESLGAELYNYTWNDNFSEARNFSLQHATMDWILVLDADESIAYRDLFYIKEYVSQNTGFRGFAFNQRDYFDEMIMGAIPCEGDLYEESKPYNCYMTQSICRILKNSNQVYFTYPVYELAEESIKLNGGEFAYTDIPIHHYGRLIGRDRAYSFLGSYLLGREYLMKALEYTPDQSVVHFDLGTNAIYRKCFYEAIDWLKKAIEIDQDRPEYYISMAQAYMFIGNIPEAANNMKKCLSIEPQNPVALNFMEKIQRKSGKIFQTPC
jgi:glycosyltransferase involved in cell wall biosynthesis